MAAKRKRRERGPKGDGYSTFDKSRGKWRAVLNGRSKYFTSERAADTWRAEQKALLNAPIVPPASDRVLVAQALYDWLTDRDWLAPSTHSLYASYITQICVAIGDKAVGDVTPSDIATMDRELRGRYVGMRAGQILQIAVSLYKRLMGRRIVTFDPVAAYMAETPPRGRQGTPLKDPHPLDYGHCRLILAALADSDYYAPIAWAMVLGLRPGELRGLRWVNVHADTVAIVEQRRAADRHTSAPLKTEREIGRGRILPLPQLLPPLVERKQSELLFPSPRDTGSLDATTLLNHLHRACTIARVPIVRMHDLRHSAGTGLRRLGCEEALISAYLGHKSSTQTGHYARPDADMLRPWVEQWAELLLGNRTNSVAQTT